MIQKTKLKNMKVTIRKAKLSDLEDVRKLNQKLFYHDFEFDKTLNLSWPKKNKKYFKERILSKNSITLIAENNNLIVGYLIGTIVNSQDYRKAIKIAELENTLILPDYRGKKIGTRLIKEFFKWAKSKKIKRAKLIASAKNKRAISVYKKNSFFEYDLVMEANL